jgi:hypothetical protein
MVDVYSKMKSDSFKSQGTSRGQALDPQVRHQGCTLVRMVPTLGDALALPTRRPRRSPPPPAAAAGGVGGGAAATTPAREIAPEPSDDEGTASLITPDREGGTAGGRRQHRLWRRCHLRAGHRTHAIHDFSPLLASAKLACARGYTNIEFIYPKLCYLTSETDDSWHIP